MIYRIAVTLALLARCASAETLLEKLPPPVDAVAPPAIVRDWTSLVVTELPRSGNLRTLELALPFTAPKGRADIFTRLDGRWVWTAAWQYSSAAPQALVAASDQRVGVLVRLAGRHEYAWGEAPGQDSSPIHLKLYRTVSVTLAGKGERVVAIFSTRADTPRTVRTRNDHVRVDFVEAGPSLICTVDAEENTGCNEDVAGASDVRVVSSPGRVVRVVRTASAFTPTAIAASFSALRPRTVNVVTMNVPGWTSLDFDRNDEQSEVAVDFQADGLAVQRLLLRDLPLVPDFGRVEAVPEHGVRVRATIRGVSAALEAGSRLLLFAPETGPADRLPLAKAVVDAEGTFTFSEIAPGPYRLKLLSAFSSDHFTAAVLTTNGVTPVVLDAAPLVKGKLELAAGGETGGGPSVMILRRDEVAALDGHESKPAPDVSSWIREAVVSEDGSFVATVHQPGDYTLRARWGHGVGSRTFTVTTPLRDVDLGIVPITDGATIRGVLHDCINGELHVTPMPDLAHPTRLTFADLRRVPVAGRGDFVVDALAAGTWLLGATCDGTTTNVDPAMVTLQDGEQVVLELHPTSVEPPATTIAKPH